MPDTTSIEAATELKNRKKEAEEWIGSLQKVNEPLRKGTNYLLLVDEI